MLLSIKVSCTVQIHSTDTIVLFGCALIAIEINLILYKCDKFVGFINILIVDKFVATSKCLFSEGNVRDRFLYLSRFLI